MQNNFWEVKNVLITGGTGFLGSWLTKELVERKAKVYCFVKKIQKDSNFERMGLNRQAKVVFGSILDIDLLKFYLDKYQIDSVFHLAAQQLVQVALKNPSDTIKTNVLGTTNVLEACRQNGQIKRIVVASTDRAYGSYEKPPCQEYYPLKGEYPYDVSKSCADLIAQAYAKTYKMPIAITRCSNIYGGGDFNFDRIIPETIKHLLFNEEITIRSNGKFKREFFYVKDAVFAYLMLAEKISELNLCGEAFNFGSNSPVEILEVVKKIISISEVKNAIINVLDSAQAEVKDQYLSSKKAKEILGWEPKYNLERGLKETYNWYKEYFKK